MKLLENKVVLITGGSRGIGAAIVRKMVQQGAAIAFTYLSSKEKAQKIVDELSAEGSKVKAYQSDASVFAEAETLVKTVLEDFGRVDVLINNAGITRDTLMLRMSEEQWDVVINYQHELSRWRFWQCRTSQLCDLQSWDIWFYQIHRQRGRIEKYSLQCFSTWIYRYRHDR